MDEKNRILHYVEVLYFDGVIYKDRKLQFYPPGECDKVFGLTVAKLSKADVIICLREENHNLLKSYSTLK
jgi:hypothetical protein